MPVPLTFSYICSIAKENGLTVNNKSYTNEQDIIFSEDSNGYRYSLAAKNFLVSLRRKNNLRIFSKANMFSIENISKWIENNNLSCEYVSGDFIGMKSKNISFKCSCGKIFKNSVERIVHPRAVNEKSREKCESCAEKIRISSNYISIDIVKETLRKLNLEIVDECSYLKITKPLFVKCLTCGHIWEKLINFVGNKQGCPRCRRSRGNLAVENFLKERKIFFVDEKRFPDCRNIFSLPFDFYLPDLNYCIEYNGEQHYKPVDFSRSAGKSKENLERAKREFLEQVRNDKIKEDYCSKNNIGLLIISYKQLNKIEEVLADFLNNL